MNLLVNRIKSAVPIIDCPANYKLVLCGDEGGGFTVLMNSARDDKRRGSRINLHNKTRRKKVPFIKKKKTAFLLPTYRESF